MVKYSFIVPVYNTEKYLGKCLDSLINQTYKDFEIVIVNDGSLDSSEKIINQYAEKYKNIVVLKQKNMGLSVARNNGVLKAHGKYLLFIDSDDYVENNLLDFVDKHIEDVDVLRFQILEEDEGNNFIKTYSEIGFDTLEGKLAFKNITEYHYVELACCYVFKRKFFIDNNFKFKPGVFHEDYGLIPFVVYSASKVKSIDFIGYHYVQRGKSIMNDSDYSKTVKKVYDMFSQYIYIKNIIKEDKINKDNYLLSYLANSAVVKARELKGNDRRKYFKALNKEKIYNDILSDTLGRKIKRWIMKLSFNLYLKVIL